jgi:hypothetical protein
MALYICGDGIVSTPSLWARAQSGRHVGHYHDQRHASASGRIALVGTDPAGASDPTTIIGFIKGSPTFGGDAVRTLQQFPNSLFYNTVLANSWICCA